MKITFYKQYMHWRLLGFARLLFWGDKFKQRFSVAGMALLSLLVLTMVFGVNTSKTLIYQMFSLLLVLFCVALLLNIILALFKKRQFVIQRQLPISATVNVPVAYSIELHNQGTPDVYRLRMGERMPVVQSSLAQFSTAHDPLEEQRNWYDRKIGFYRFVWLQTWLRGGEFHTQIVEKIATQQVFYQTMHFTPIRRGWVHFSRLRLALAEPFGLMYRFETHEQAQSLLVLPKRYVIPQHLSLVGVQQYQQGGITQISAADDTQEFQSLREYRAGDSPRHIHWASLAKAEKPLVKQYQDEHFSRQVLVLDSFADETKADTFEEAVSLAAGFALTMEHGDCLLDMMFIHKTNKHTGTLTFDCALEQPEQMLQALANLDVCSQAKFQDLADLVLRQSTSFGACVLIVMAWDEERLAFVRQLLAQDIVLRVFLLIESKDNTVYRSLVELEGHFHVLRAGEVQQGLDNIDVV
ncbi:MAG: DUF58 domain-containing protein [Mariprofundaceae bacterium]|nr:DUF58 domain-containing protein [Mariprofundaceae bacterium]